MSAKHTPGPWEAQGDVVYAGDLQIAILDGRYGGGPREDAINAANAQLIATAPDMLAALKHVLCLFEPGSSGHREAMQAVRAAVKRAESVE